MAGFFAYIKHDKKDIYGARFSQTREVIATFMGTTGNYIFIVAFLHSNQMSMVQAASHDNISKGRSINAATSSIPIVQVKERAAS